MCKEEMNEQKDILILAIESSCDETAAAVVKNGREVLSNIISSQIALHTLYGGVVPEIASRKHIEKINQVIEEALQTADVTLDDLDAIAFPKAKIADSPYDFSFSGLKSSVLNYLNGAKMKGETVNRADVAASFQKAVCDVLVSHAITAVKEAGMDKLAIAGGVASNGTLRAAMEEACKKNNYSFYRPSPIFCTDNAAMIGVAAYYEYIKGTRHGWDLNAVPNLKLGER